MITAIVFLLILYFIVQSKKSNDFLTKLFTGLIKIVLFLMLVYVIVEWFFFAFPNFSIECLYCHFTEFFSTHKTKLLYSIMIITILIISRLLFKYRRSILVKLLVFPFRGILWLLDALIFKLNKKNTYSFGKAKFLPVLKQWFLLNIFNKGLCINGRQFISLKNTFQHFILIAPTGSGKTVRFILNELLLKIKKKQRSVILTDPSGELHKTSHSYLKLMGYKIKIFNVEKAQDFYNPLAYIKTHAQLSELIELIIDINGSQGNTSDPFWAESSKNICNLVTKALLDKYEEQATLPMLLNYVDLLSIKGNKTVHELMSNHLYEKDFNAYKAFIAQDKKLKASILATAKSALFKFSDPNLAHILSKDTLDLHNIRNEKTIVYLVIPEQKQHYYRMIATLFYSQLFDIAMNTTGKTSNQLPLYFLMEEAGNLAKIPSLKTVITAGRKRKISVSIILQDMPQLQSIYGAMDSKTIFSNCLNKLVYGGLDIQDAELFSRMIGPTTLMKADDTWQLKYLFKSQKKREFKKALLSANEIRSLDEDKALFLSGNKQAIITYTKPYFKNRRLMRRLKAAQQQESIIEIETLEEEQEININNN